MPFLVIFPCGSSLRINSHGWRLPRWAHHLSSSLRVPGPVLEAPIAMRESPRLSGVSSVCRRFHPPTLALSGHPARTCGRYGAPNRNPRSFAIAGDHFHKTGQVATPAWLGPATGFVKATRYAGESMVSAGRSLLPLGISRGGRISNPSKSAPSLAVPVSFANCQWRVSAFHAAADGVILPAPIPHGNA